MLFDVLAKAITSGAAAFGKDAEAMASTARYLTAQSNLFVFPFEVSGLYGDEYTKEEMDQLTSGYFCPFPVTAVEDTHSLAIFLEPDKQGYRCCLDFNKSPDPKLPHAYMLTAVLLKVDRIATTQAQLDIEFKGALLFNRKCEHSKLAIVGFMDRKSMGDEAAKECGQNAFVTMKEIVKINTMDRFILKTEPASGQKITKRIALSHERPKYTILRPGEIRKAMGLPEPTESERGPNAPHWRRKHFHTFKHERFTKKKGQTIVIPAVWVGPSEAVVGGKRYKVMLDL